MKAKDIDRFDPMPVRARKSSRRAPQGMGLSSALLGIACGVGVFGVLTLLYHFG